MNKIFTTFQHRLIIILSISYKINMQMLNLSIFFYPLKDQALDFRVGKLRVLLEIWKIPTNEPKRILEKSFLLPTLPLFPLSQRLRIGPQLPIHLKVLQIVLGHLGFNLSNELN